MSNGQPMPDRCPSFTITHAVAALAAEVRDAIARRDSVAEFLSAQAAHLGLKAAAD
jgi:hypothetical protein